MYSILVRPNLGSSDVLLTSTSREEFGAMLQVAAGVVDNFGQHHVLFRTAKNLDFPTREKQFWVQVTALFQTYFFKYPVMSQL